MTKTEAKTAAPGTTVHTNLLGTVTLVRLTNGESGVEGWVVQRSDGTAAFLYYEDFELTELEVDEIRNAFAANRACIHNQVFPVFRDQSLGVACLACKAPLGVCWGADQHVSEALWNRACLNDDEANPCEQNRDDHCAICERTMPDQGEGT